MAPGHLCNLLEQVPELGARLQESVLLLAPAISLLLFLAVLGSVSITSFSITSISISSSSGLVQCLSHSATEKKLLALPEHPPYWNLV